MTLECEPKWKCKWCSKCVLCEHSLNKSYWHAFLYGVMHPFETAADRLEHPNG